MTRRYGFVVLVLCLTLTSVPHVLPQGATVPASRTSSRDIDVRIMRIDVFDVVSNGPLLRVPRTVAVFGTVDNQPYSSEIRVAISCDGRTFRLIEGVPFGSVNGDWRLPSAMLVPPPSVGVFRCELLAFVADPIREPTLDRAALFNGTRQLSDFIALEVDARAKVEPMPEVLVDSTAGQPVVPGTAMVVPWLFDVRGRTRHVPDGHDLFAMMACNQSTRWHRAGTIAVEPQGGAWSLPSITLPDVRAGSRCAFVIIASSKRITASESYSREELRELGAIRSNEIELIQRPAFVSIRMMTERSGVAHSIDNVLRERPGGVVTLARPLSSISGGLDPVPPEAHVEIAIQMPGSSFWLIVGRGHLDGPDVWTSANAAVVPSRASSDAIAVRAIVTLENLQGRAMSAEALEMAALGMSEIVRVRPPAERPCRVAVARIAHVNGEEPDGHPIANVQRLRLDGELRHNCAGAVGWLALGGAPSGQWRVFPVRPAAGGRWELSIDVPVAERGEVEPRRQLGFFVAPDVLESSLVDERWLHALSKVFAPSTVEVVLQRPPWLTTIGDWALRITGSQEERIGMDTMTAVWTLGSPWLLLVASVLLLLAMQRRLMKPHAWFNGFRDAGKVDRRSGPAPYEQRLEEERNLARARAQGRLEPGNAALRVGIQEHTWVPVPAGAQMLGKPDGAAPPVSAPSQIGISRTAHNIALTLASVGESAFNIVAFRALHEPDAFTFLMSLSVSATLPVAAYFIGLAAKRWQAGGRHVTALLTVTAVIIVAALWGINEIRIAHLKTIDPGFLDANPTLNIVFIPVNLLVVFGTTLLAYMRHDPAHIRQETAARRQPKLKRTLAKREARLAAQLAQIDARYAVLRHVYLGAYERYRPAPRVNHDLPRENGAARPTGDRPTIVKKARGQHDPAAVPVPPTSEVDPSGNGHGRGVLK